MNITVSFHKIALTAILTLALASQASSQAAANVPTSVQAGPIIDAAGPEQRAALTAIYLIACPNVGFGSGFLLDTGVIVTNVHVVATCTERDLFGISTTNSRVTFSHVIPDKNRDLALLVPSAKLSNGLKLAEKFNPEPGTAVSTWGYPFGYAGISPLLSVGYVSGYREPVDTGQAVKHIVVNGAFNHGNSGGPLMISRTNKVIGVVVLTFHFYPPELQTIIDALASEKFGMMYEEVHPDGKKNSVSEAQLTATVLQEFYEKTQVMIGEAVSGSELAAMIKEHSSELPAKTSRNR
jgi:S1-C subfamily serine protease